MSTPTRLADWRLRLDALLCARVHAPFDWRTNNCALWAADAVHAMTGVDLAADLRTARSAREALRIVRRAGGLWSLAARILGPWLPAWAAHEGDVLLVPMGHRHQALGICLPGAWVCGPGPTCLTVVPRETAICAWHIPEAAT